MKTDDSRDIMIDLIKVTKHYPPDVIALTNITFSVYSGEMVFLTGRSGAGKTSLLKLISRIERPTKGMVEVDGVDIGKLHSKKLHTLRRKIGMAYQDFKLLPERSVAANIAISMEVAHRNHSFIQKRTRELLEQLGLQQKINTPTRELSRGEQQRVSIARAVANFPQVILADEPTGNLDADSTTKVMDLFRIMLQHGSTILIATHDTSIYDSNHRVIRLQHGQQQGLSADSSDTAETGEPLLIPLPQNP